MWLLLPLLLAAQPPAPVLGTWGANSCGHVPWMCTVDELSFAVHPLHGCTLTSWPAEWPVGDYTGDGRVGAFDAHIMQQCIGGPGLPLPTDLLYQGQYFDEASATFYSGAWVIPCYLFDFDCDGDVDMVDYGIQQARHP